MPQSRHISDEADELEAQIKKRYGKRGRAMIHAARQNVEYELDSSNYSEIQYIRLYIAELQKRL